VAVSFADLDWNRAPARVTMAGSRTFRVPGHRLSRILTPVLAQILRRRGNEPLPAACAAEQVFLALERVPVRRVGANAHAAHWVDRSMAFVLVGPGRGMVGMLIH
jgi:hypothetical protein